MSRFASLFTGTGEESGESTLESKPSAYKMLLVDDDVNVVKALRRVFRQENYEISTAENGNEALEHLSKQHFHLMISDYKMPGMNGAELLKRAKNMHPDMIRIMLTGHADTSAVMGAINEGAVFKFILKPWNDDDLRVTVALGLEKYDLIQRNRALQQDNSKKSKEIQTLSKISVANRSQLAIMLHKKNLLNQQQVQELYKVQQTKKGPMIQVLLDKGWVDEKAIRKILKNDLLVDEVLLNEFRVEQVAKEILPRSFCEKQLVLPLKVEGRSLMLAVADPLDTGLVDDLRFATGLEVQTVMANVAEILAKVDDVYGDGEIHGIDELEASASGADPLDTIEVVIEEEDDSSLEDLLHSTDDPPAIRLVNAILLEALRLGASDIHIQPRAKHVVVRLRIDGVLSDKIHVPHNLYPSLVSRIKIMAELDIAERRRPQDGRITVKTPMRIVDLRISTLPTVNGEKLVMRILDRNSSIHRLEELGFCDADLTKVRHIVSQPQGIILATGPTGSGKTTTLYSLLQHDASSGKNYVTLEDPVEYYLDMAGQVHVKERIGVSFATVLRAILRQDPDVLLLGEIRDTETAEVAFDAAMTGHLVFSTLHTNSAVATIARLLDLGLKPYVLASALQGIIAQRLIRSICDECKEPVAPTVDVMRRLGPLFEPTKTRTFHGRGCTKCAETGYRGRIPIFEVLVPNVEMLDLIGGGASVLEIGRMAARAGTGSLLEDSWAKVNAGLTTPEEVLRVLGSQVIR